MKCELCGANSRINYGNSNAVLCESCSKKGEGVELTKQDKNPINESQTNVSSVTSNYEVAQKIATIMSFIGWTIVVIGVMVALVGSAGMSQNPYARGGSAIIGLLPGIGMSISGFFLVAGAQVTRAMVDNADNTREILNLMREQRA